MPLLRLNITTCIVIGDARRLEEGKTPVRNIKGLSRELECLDEDEYDADKICKILYRSNGSGVISVPDRLLEDLQNTLMVKEDELIKYPQS